MNPSSINVDHGRSNSQLYCDDQELLQLKRTILSRKIMNETDAYGDFSLLAIAEPDLNQLKVRHEGSLYQLHGKLAILVPPFSVMEWIISPGRLCFQACIGNLSSFTVQKEPCVYHLEALPKELNAQTIQEVLSSERKTVLVSHHSHVIVRRVKAYIDCHFRSECSIESIADRLSVNRSTMTRLFTEWYGIPPVTYRNNLRVFYAKFQLLKKSSSSVSEIGLDAGFEDLAHFNRTFKSVVNAVPSKFRLKN